MTAPDHSQTRLGLLAALALALSVGVTASSCYSPSIVDGGFKCSSTYKMDCPSGYFCAADDRCHRNGYDASVEPVAETKPDAAMEAPMEAPMDKPPEAAPDKPPEVAPMCIVKPTPCTPAGGGATCDLLCQTGCPSCDQKCSANTSTGALICNPASGTLSRHLGESCSPVSAGSASQMDDCDPGLVCVTGTCGSSCFKFCRGDGDCGNSQCSRTLPGGVKYCDVAPTTTCNPVTKLGTTNCPGINQGCYVSATVADETRCDCEMHSQGPGDPCTQSRDCLPGLVCADVTGTNIFVCAVACALTGAQSGCTPPTTCMPIQGSVKYGFCN